MQRNLSIILLSIAMAASSTGIAQKAAPTKVGEASNNSYYVFGIVSVPPKTISAIEKDYGIRVVNSSCMLDKKKLAKNSIIDSMVLAKHQKSMSAILHAAR
jgi:hypothetical protein